MIEVILLLGATGFLTLAAVWRLLKYRFPHPADLIALSIFYYSIPLAAFAIFFPDLGRLAFLHSAAVDRAVALQSLRYSLLALVCLEVGRWLAKRVRRSRRLEFSLLPADREKSSIVLAALLGVIALGIALYGPGSFFAGYNVPSEERTAALGNALIYATIELVGLTIGYIFLVSRAQGTRFMSVLLSVAIALLVFLAVVRGKRLEVVSAFLPLAVLVFATNPLFRRSGSRALTVGLIAILMAVLAAVRLGLTPTPASVGFYLLSEGVYAGHALPGIIDRLNVGEVGYEYGTRIGLALLAFVPRFIWPTKDDIVYVGNEALNGVAPGGATNILAEVLLQGGGTAVIVWYFTLAFIGERVYSAHRDFDAGLRARRLPGSILIYLIFIATFIPHFRDGLIPSIKVLLQASVFVFALAGLAPSQPITWRARISQRGRSAIGA